MVNKLILILVFMLLSTLAFSASELDDLLKEDEDIFSELMADDVQLEKKNAYVEEMFGQAFLQHENEEKWFQIVDGSEIRENDTLLTMESSGVKVRMEDETYINIGAKSKLYFDTMRGKPDVELMTETGLKLAWGKVFSNVRKKIETGGRYEIEAQGVVAGVRGTQFEVMADKKGEVKVKVFEGRVFLMPRELYIRKRKEFKADIKKKKMTSDKEASKEKKVEFSELKNEIVLTKNKEMIVDSDRKIGELREHFDSAPLKLIKQNEVIDEIQGIVEDAKDNLNLDEKLDQTEEQLTDTESDIDKLEDEIDKTLEEMEDDTVEENETGTLIIEIK